MLLWGIQSVYTVTNLGQSKGSPSRPGGSVHAVGECHNNQVRHLSRWCHVSIRNTTTAIWHN